MISEDRRHRRRPLDRILNPQLPTSPATSTGPVDEVLGEDGGNGGGETNPWVNPFMEVYKKTKAGAMTNLADIQKQMGESFAHKGGYFGGKHAIAQGETAARTGTALDQLLAQTELGASERQYQDWQRAENQKMGLMNLIPMLLGTDTFQNIVQMPGQGAGSLIGSLLGIGAGSFAGGAGSAMGSNVGGKGSTH